MKETHFAILNELGFEEVQRRRNRGQLDGSDEWTREWLELRGVERLEEAHDLHKRATVAAERSADASEKAATASQLSARFAMYAAIISLVATVVTMCTPK